MVIFNSYVKLPEGMSLEGTMRGPLVMLVGLDSPQ